MFQTAVLVERGGEGDDGFRAQARAPLRL